MYKIGRDLPAAKALEAVKRGITTGISKLDEATTGFQPGELIVIGGCSSMGKSALMIDMVRAASREVPVLVFPIEEGALLFLQRLIYNLAQANFHVGQLEGLETPEALSAVQILESKHNIYIGESRTVVPAWRLKFPLPEGEAFINIEIAEAAKCGCKIVFLDYLGLVEYGAKTQREDLRLHAITRELKLLAVELKMTVVLLHQLKKEVATRSDPTPNLNDVRDAGQVINNADKVILVHRPEYYDKKEELDIYGDHIEEAQLIIAKQRAGPTGIIKVKFLPFCMSFVEEYL